MDHERRMANSTESPARARSFKEYVDWGVSVVLGVCAIVLTIVLVGRARTIEEPEPSFQIPATPEPIGTWIAGDRASARVGVVMFSDYQCPFCGRFARQVWPELRKRYVESGQALFDFRQLPLQSIHPLALPAARASLCAARQGKLWDFHDRLFAENADLTPQGLFQSAAAVDVDLLEWQACLNASTVNQEIERDVQTARRLGINSTPFFVVGVVAGDKIRFTGSVRGAKRAGDLSRAIDEALQMSTPQR